MKPIPTLTIVAIPLMVLMPQVPVWAQGAALAADGQAEAVEATEADAVEALPDAVDTEAVNEVVEGLVVMDGSEAQLDSFLWEKRLILLFANTPNDPAFQQQLESILERAEEFVERDVVVITDTDPDANSDARRRLRPRGYMMAIIDKDGEVKQRRPAPRSARELMAVIDRFPLRRQEMMERLPSGRN